jgi:bifunctional DNase/RNase
MDASEPMSIQVLGLQIDPTSGTSIVLLGESDMPRRVLPIFIGPAEAQAIAIVAQGIELPRPGTHDLLVSALHAARARVIRVAIVGLHDHTFIGELHIETTLGSEAVDARPSDAIAVALREAAPIVVDPDVFRTASIELLRDPDEPFEQDEIDRLVDEFHDFLSTAQPADFAEGATSPDVSSDPDDT